eukprot:TRINITY_DN26774_c0_g1_i2.p1 TRINITY_DN26774_c0_g1~~TRINITY_DN26774_c0_g1_i2.p1  ORF type:complete len:238 (-),score=30.07 TRINITY_DN26774_c0_g1_i2:91-717(-)
MFYCCQAVGTVLSAPCKCCDAACKECSKSCSSCIDAINNCLGPISKAPLASYVIGTWFTMVIIIAGVAYSFVKMECVGTSSPKAYCAVQIAFAVIHAGVAFYLQRRLINKTGKSLAKDMTHREIVNATWSIVGYDFVFCFYVLIFFGGFGYTFAGYTDFDKCTNSGPVWAASTLMAFYCVGMFNYFFCWFGCQCCCGAAERAQVGGKQ